MSTRDAAFELARFTVDPVSARVALLELEGRIEGGEAGSVELPRLVVERADGSRAEHVALEATTASRRIRACFAVPLADVDGRPLGLAAGGLLIDLPTPDPSQPGDRTVELARSVNALRHERTALRQAAATHAGELERQAALAAERLAAAEAAAHDREQEALARQQAAAREAAERHATVLREASEQHGEQLRQTRVGLESALEEARARRGTDAAAAGRERAEALARAEAAEAERDAAVAELEAAGARTQEAQRGAKAVRAELEALQRRVARGGGVGGDGAAVDGGGDGAPAVARSGRTATGDAVAARSGGPVTSTAATGGHHDGVAVVVAGATAVAADDTANGTATTVSRAEPVDGRPIARRPDTGGPPTRRPPTVGGRGPLPAGPAQDPRPAPGGPTASAGQGPAPGAERPTGIPRTRRTTGVTPPDPNAPLGVRSGIAALDDGAQSETVRVLGRDRPRASALPPRPDAEIGPPVRFTPRQLAVAAVSIAGVLILIALLGYLF